jgi:hypothetical protein
MTVQGAAGVAAASLGICLPEIQQADERRMNRA